MSRSFILFILAQAICIGTAFCEEWIITKKGNFFFLKKGTRQYAIDFDQGRPTFVKEKKLNENYSVVIYKSGELGTKTLTVIERCLVFKNGTYQDNIPYRYYTKGQRDKPYGVTWKVEKDQLLVTDSEMNERWSF